jgi:cell fate (sporulation/competence/biofilm development) regulator YlbF (YheA/YmcA/DUF963 family)
VLDRTVETAARTLAAKLKATPAIAAFEQAQVELEADEPARSMMAELQQLQDTLLQKQQMGTLTQGEIDAYRGLQRKVQDNPIIQAYFEAQRQAQAFLPQVNMEISQMLGFDFNRLAGAAGC